MHIEEHDGNDENNEGEHSCRYWFIQIGSNELLPIEVFSIDSTESQDSETLEETVARFKEDPDYDSN